MFKHSPKGKSLKKLSHCYGLNVSVSHKIPILRPKSPVMIFEDGSFGRQLGCESGGPVLG